MDGEIKSLVKVWLTAMTSLCYCYFIAGSFPKGFVRLLSLLPVFCLFIVLPLDVSSVHLGGPTAFYLAWLANFKLILFSFDLGPLSSHPPKPLLHFISLACLPIKIKQDPSPKTPPFSETAPKITKNNTNPSPSNPQLAPKSSPNLETNPDPSSQVAFSVPRPVLLAVKALILAAIIRIYDYRPHLHPYVILALYCCHVYIGVEIVLAASAALARAIHGLEFEPQFHEPYLATSLQDFWGRRWNLMVTSILRPTVYNPIRQISAHVLGRVWASVPATLVTFLVSGFMHELIFFYLTRADPTWEVTWFFVLHGLCVAAEVVAKKAVNGRRRLHPAVSGPLAVAFVVVTGGWLFLPQLLRNGVDQRAIRELSIALDFAKGSLPLPQKQYK